jgi:hypothetical protein
MTDEIDKLKEQTQATSRVSKAADEQSATDLRERIINELEAIEDGQRKTLAIRDESLSALFRALEANEAEMRDALEDLASELDRDVEDETRSELLRLAARVGLQTAVPEVWDEVLEARKDRVARQA